MRKGRLVYTKTHKVWFFWTWLTTYEGNPLYNRFGLTRTEDKAFAKCIRATQNIIDYEHKIGLP